MSSATGLGASSARGLRVGVGEALALVSVVGYTLVNGLMRTVSSSVDPFAASFTRLLPLFVIGTAAVLITRPAALNPASTLRLRPRDIGLLMGGGVLSFLVGNVLMLQAFAWGGLSVAVVATQGGMVVGGIVGSTVILKERPRRWQAIGAGVVCLGLAVSLTQGFLGQNAGWTTLLGFLFAFLSGSCYVTANMASRNVQRKQDKTFLATLFITNLAGVMALGLTGLIRSWTSQTGFLAGMTAPEFWTMLGVGLANALAIGSVTLATKYTTVASISTISALIIATSMLVAILIFHEPTPPTLIVGAALIVVGVVLAQTSSRTPNRRAQQ